VANLLLLGFWLWQLLLLIASKLGEVFPGRAEIESSKLLGEFDGLLHYSPEFVIPSALIESREGKVLSERVTLESVVGQNSSKIGVIAEEDAVHVPALALVPVGTFVERYDGFDGAKFVTVSLHPNPSGVIDRKKVVDHLEPVNPRWHITCGKI